ncbi:Nibrin, NBN [Carpediemonas membranifera]|uniref:Nibrin, NBN n=1 Tax=Carpediemonas membranifera TaxID=201153 RepID=A0A8J6B7L5_9EUKA|nr:Nibrin, NBN [Carpediemonas membranifera]|eukprot:KAG9394799.1 Nibrin, NBN [Carpediemonas membranifera]
MNSFFFHKLPIVVGRRDADVVILDPSISRTHAVIDNRQNDAMVLDIEDKSKTGVVIDGTPIRRGGTGQLAVGQTVTFGPSPKNSFTLAYTPVSVIIGHISPRSKLRPFSSHLGALGIPYPAPMGTANLLVTTHLHPDPTNVHAAAHGALAVTPDYFGALSKSIAHGVATTVPDPMDYIPPPSPALKKIARLVSGLEEADLVPAIPRRSAFLRRYAIYTTDSELESLVMVSGGTPVNPTTPVPTDHALVLVADDLDDVDPKIVALAKATHAGNMGEQGSPIGRTFILNHNEMILAVILGVLRLGESVQFMSTPSQSQDVTPSTAPITEVVEAAEATLPRESGPKSRLPDHDSDSDGVEEVDLSEVEQAEAPPPVAKTGRRVAVKSKAPQPAPVSAEPQGDQQPQATANHPGAMMRTVVSTGWVRLARTEKRARR